MKLAICDDEKMIREYIAKCASEVSKNLEIVCFANAQGILAPDFDADILLLDIQMPGVDGMNAARMLRQAKKKTVIVFETALEEYVFDAFDVGAFQYIVKPFEKNRLMDVLQKAIVQANEQNSVEELLKKAEKENGRSIMVKSGGANTRVILAEVAYAEVFDRHIILHMANRDQIEYYGRMNELDQMAGNDFFRVHRAYLINLGHVKAYDSKCVRILEEEIPVARGKYQELVKAYLSYNARRENF